MVGLSSKIVSGIDGKPSLDTLETLIGEVGLDRLTWRDLKESKLDNREVENLRTLLANEETPRACMLRGCIGLILGHYDQAANEFAKVPTTKPGSQEAAEAQLHLLQFGMLTNPAATLPDIEEFLSTPLVTRDDELHVNGLQSRGISNFMLGKLKETIDDTTKAIEILSVDRNDVLTFHMVDPQQLWTSLLGIRMQAYLAMEEIELAAQDLKSIGSLPQDFLNELPNIATKGQANMLEALADIGSSNRVPKEVDPVKDAAMDQLIDSVSGQIVVSANYGRGVLDLHPASDTQPGREGVTLPTEGDSQLQEIFDSAKQNIRQGWSTLITEKYSDHPDFTNWLLKRLERCLDTGDWEQILLESVALRRNWLSGAASAVLSVLNVRGEVAPLAIMQFNAWAIEHASEGNEPPPDRLDLWAQVSPQSQQVLTIFWTYWKIMGQRPEAGENWHPGDQVGELTSMAELSIGLKQYHVAGVLFTNAGQYYHRQGEHASARQSHQSALEAFSKVPKELYAQTALFDGLSALELSNYASDEGNVGRYISLLEHAAQAAITVCRSGWETDRENLLASVLTSLASWYTAQTRYDSALPLGRIILESLDAFSPTWRSYFEATAHFIVGGNLCDLDSPHEALLHLNSCIAISEGQNQSPPGFSHTDIHTSALVVRSMVHRNLNQLQLARTDLNAAMSLFQNDKTVSYVNALYEFASLEEDYDRARGYKLAKEALVCFDSLPESELRKPMTIGFSCKSLLARTCQDTDLANQYLVSCCEELSQLCVKEPTVYRREYCRCLLSLSYNCMDRGRFSESEEYLRIASEQCDLLDDAATAFDRRINAVKDWYFARVYLNQSRLEQAQFHCERALSNFRPLFAQSASKYASSYLSVLLLSAAINRQLNQQTEVSHALSTMQHVLSSASLSKRIHAIYTALFCFENQQSLNHGAGERSLKSQQKLLETAEMGLRALSTDDGNVDDELSFIISQRAVLAYRCQDRQTFSKLLDEVEDLVLNRLDPTEFECRLRLYSLKWLQNLDEVCSGLRTDFGDAFLLEDLLSSSDTRNVGGLNFLINRARIMFEMRLGSIDECVDLLVKARNLANEIRSSSLSFVQRWESQQTAGLALHLIVAALQEGGVDAFRKHKDLAFQCGEEMRARTLFEMRVKAQLHRRSSDSNNLDSIIDDLFETSRQTARLSGSPADFLPTAGLLVKSTLAQAESERALLIRTLFESLDFRQDNGGDEFLYNPTTVITLADLQVALPDDATAAMQIFSSTSFARDCQSIAFVIKKGEVEVIPLAEHDGVMNSRDLAMHWSNEYVKFCSAEQWTEPDERFKHWNLAIEYAMQQLGTRLVAPCLGALQDVSHLIVSPQGEFHRFPLHAVRTGSHSCERLMERLTVSYVPSFSAFFKNAPSRTSFENGLVLGVPDESAFMNLEISRMQLRTIQAQHINPLEGKSVFEASQFCAVWHYVGHARFHSTQPGQSCLETSEGIPWLTVHEAMTRLTLDNAELVVLSACESGMLRPDRLDEHVSFPAAFLSSGAMCVVSTLWEVPDVPTFLLIDRMYDYLSNGLTVAEALNRAQRWLSGDPNCPGALSSVAALKAYVAEVFPNATRSEKWHFEGWYDNEGAPFEDPIYWAAFTAHGATWNRIPAINHHK